MDEDSSDDRSFTESEKARHRKLWETSSTEDLIKGWGEKAGGLRWMHAKSAEFWRLKDERLNLANVLMSCFTSATAFLGSVTTSTQRLIPSEYVMMFVGFVGLANVVMLSITQYYKSPEKAMVHENASKQFGNFNRFIATRLSLSTADRGDPREVMRYSLKENERLHNENVEPHPFSVECYKEFVCNNVSNEKDICLNVTNFVLPDILNTSFGITTYDEKQRNSVDVKNWQDNASFSPSRKP